MLECVCGLLAQSCPLSAIYIIDNASTDGTRDKLLEAGYLDVDVVHYIRLSENTGGAGGFSAGMKQAHQDGYEWVWVMDDDVEPDAHCLERLSAHFDDYDVLTPLRIAQDGHLQEFNGLELDLKKFRLKLTAIKRPVREVYRSISELPDVLEVADLSFEGPIFNRRIIDGNGYPRAEYFIGADDLEYCLRVKKNFPGIRFGMVTDAHLIRKLPVQLSPGDGTRYQFTWKNYYELRNYTHVYKEYGEGLSAKISPLIAAFVLLGKAAARFQGARIRLIWFAVIDGYLGRFRNRYVPGPEKY